MTDIQAWIDQGRTLADQAADHVGRLAAGDDKWTMTVPPKDTDSDIALLSLLDGRLPQALAALQAVLDLHKKRHRSLQRWWIAPGSIEPQPVTTPDTCDYCRGNYPCPTVRAIQDAIGEQDA